MTATWTPRNGHPTPITFLNTQHLFEILRFLIRRSLPAWQRVYPKSLHPEDLADGPITLAENGGTFDAIMEELDRRELDWLHLYTELRWYSRGLVREVVDPEEAARLSRPLFSESDPIPEGGDA
jgi:hypothetical protein